jgi:hypothetical protein
MRSGTQLRCVVNGAAGREARFAGAAPPRGERIAVIGAGPAGLTYAALVAAENTVTVFERDRRVGGAFRLAGLAPRFQDVAASAWSLERYVRDLAAACAHKGATIRTGVDILKDPAVLAPFDRIVIATGARYRFGLGPLTRALLRSGVARWPFVRRLLANPALRAWFYYRARAASGELCARAAGPRQKVVVIGDAAKAGKSKEAVAGAFDAALLAEETRAESSSAE